MRAILSWRHSTVSERSNTGSVPPPQKQSRDEGSRSLHLLGNKRPAWHPHRDFTMTMRGVYNIPSSAQSSGLEKASSRGPYWRLLEAFNGSSAARRGQKYRRNLSWRSRQKDLSSLHTSAFLQDIHSAEGHVKLVSSSLSLTKWVCWWDSYVTLSGVYWWPVAAGHTVLHA